jgi:outer membrane protein
MKTVILLLLFSRAVVVSAQDTLQEYIHVGLENNLALQQQEAGFRKSLEALKQARGLFYPALAVNARYSVAEGGRTIEFPIGDLLNPVYATLNQLTSSNAFPQVENQEFLFLRPNEQDTRLRFIQPVFNSDLYYNAKIKKEMAGAEEISMNQYRQELVAEIKKAYYAVGMTRSILTMLEQTRLLLVENVRVNERLVENDKVTRDNLYRSQTELSKFDQQFLVARKNGLNAKAYFNFLLNKPLMDTIYTEMLPEMPRLLDKLNNYTKQALDNREELKYLEKYIDISALQIKMNQSSALPDLLVVADYGFQGETYQFNRDQDYLQASVVLNWKLFQGFENRAKIREAYIQKEILDKQLEEARSRIELQVTSTLIGLRATEMSLVSAESQVKSAREGFRLVNRKYNEGQSTLVEFLDARSTLTQAEANLIISRYTYLSDFAEFEKEIALVKP